MLTFFLKHDTIIIVNKVFELNERGKYKKAAFAKSNADHREHLQLIHSIVKLYKTM